MKNNNNLNLYLGESCSFFISKKKDGLYFEHEFISFNDLRSLFYERLR